MVFIAQQIKCFMETKTESITIYLCENEHPGDNYMRELDITLALNPRDLYEIEEGHWKIIDERKLTTEEIRELGKEGGGLYGLFGRTDLSAKPGLPKGPYYSVQQEVYDMVERIKGSADKRREKPESVRLTFSYYDGFENCGRVTREVCIDKDTVMKELCEKPLAGVPTNYSDKEGFPTVFYQSDSARVDLLWINDIGKWVARVDDTFTEGYEQGTVLYSGGESGPYLPNKPALEKICEAFKIPPGKMPLEEILNTSPEKLKELGNQ